MIFKGFQFRPFLTFIVLLMASVSLQAQSNVPDLVFKQPSNEEHFKQFLIVNGSTAVALAREKKGRKLTNTILLIKNEKIIDSYVHNSSLDFIHVVDDNSFIAFQPLGSQVLFKLGPEGLVKVDRIKIPFFKSLWSSSSMEGILGFHKGFSIYFDQNKGGKTIARYDSTSTPSFFIYNGTKSFQVNKTGQKTNYQHWPRYAEVATPPMTYIRLVGHVIYISISNVGLIYAFDTNSNKVESIKFPIRNDVKSWGMFYDHVNQEDYWVAYVGKDQFEVFKNDGYAKEAIVINGFFDSIAGGVALQKTVSDDGVKYSLVKIEN